MLNPSMTESLIAIKFYASSNPYSPKFESYKPSFEVSNNHSPRLDSPYSHSTYKSSVRESSENNPKPPLADLPKLEQKPFSSHEKVQLGNKGKWIMAQVDGGFDGENNRSSST